jgi:hypothetical protein
MHMPRVGANQQINLHAMRARQRPLFAGVLADGRRLLSKNEILGGEV